MPDSNRNPHLPGSVLFFSLLGVLGMTARGCEPPAELAAIECAPVPADASGYVPLETLTGDYLITFFAQEGAAAGRSLTGSLLLVEYEVGSPGPAGITADPAVQYPVHGSLTGISPDSLGATAPGPIDAAHHDRPGVLGIEWQTASAQSTVRQSILRLGADANAGGPARFDGGYFTLTPTSADLTTFTGRWASGTGRPAAGGYFCASRPR